MSLRVDLDHRQGAFRLRAAFAADSGVTALFGPSGAGKTTALDLIAGVRRLDSGRVEFDGRVLADSARGTRTPSHRRRIGYVFQEPRLFPHLSVRRNLLYGYRFARRRRAVASLDQVVALLDLVGLLHRRPAGLSGGEARRVAIGRALLSAPRLLLLDEPLASLDDARRAEILPFIERLRDALGIPMLYVSHRADEVARLADTVIVLRDGRIVTTGPPAAVLSQPGLLNADDADARVDAARGRIDRASSE